MQDLGHGRCENCCDTTIEDSGYSFPVSEGPLAAVQVVVRERSVGNGIERFEQVLGIGAPSSIKRNSDCPVVVAIVAADLFVFARFFNLRSFQV